MSDSDQHQFKDRYMLRLPDGMRDRIKTAAAKNNRSMNAEIVARIEASFASSSPHAEDGKLSVAFPLPKNEKTRADLIDMISGIIVAVEEMSDPDTPA